MAQSQVRFPELLDHAPDAITLHDAAAMVVDANEEACRQLGYTREELVGMPVGRFVEGLEAETLARVIDHLRQAGVASYHAVHRRKDGTTFPVETRLALVRRQAQTLVVAFSRDRSAEEAARSALRRAEAEREALQERVRQSERLEALGTLAGGVAHDFNNVLAAILGHAEALAGELPSGSVGREDAEQIAVAARRARGVVQQILAFARRRPTEAEPVDVSRAVREELALVRAATPANVDIVARLDPRAGAVQADPTQLHQVLLNLSANARDAMAPRGGRIEVATDAAEVPSDGAPAGLPAGRYVRLTVSDTGPGMDAATRARAFEPYFTTKPPGVGSGLGLSVVHGIASGLGGAVKLVSAAGEGTRVEVWLPRLPEPAPTPAPIAPVPSGDRRRILLVDDDPPVARAISRMLSALGYEVTVEGSAEAGLERFRGDPGAFDVVITDQTLPRMGGDELTLALLAIRPDVPVLICTGYSARLDELEALAIGARALLPKPIDLHQLGDAVAAALTPK